AFYTPAQVPTSSYRLGTPLDLNSCDDIYAMPHADPQNWDNATETTFNNFIVNGGYLWAACHAVSAIESPAPSYLGFYYLTTNGTLDWNQHGDGSAPYSYTAHTDPIM